jgi:predicted nucleic acid-binding protein
LTLVVDASVAVKWVLEEPLWEHARALLTSEAELVAPDFLVLDVANALWKRIRRGELDYTDAQLRIDTLIEGDPEFFESGFLIRDALELAATLDHSVYDCLYLALAVHEGTQVMTADQRFHKRVEASEYAGFIRLLADQPPRGDG